MSESPAALNSIKVFHWDYVYLDSGAPTSPNYTTWVIIRGMGFNAGSFLPDERAKLLPFPLRDTAVFEKLLPLAHRHNLRIVSVYRRGYPPSSGFQEDELKGIGKEKKIDDVKSFFCSQGTEIATFLAKFAVEQGIPLRHLDSPTGGIVLIGWSVGGIHVLTVLAHADEFPADTRSTLQNYLHTTLFHDPSPTAFGMSNPGRDNVGQWPGTDDRERFDALFDWVTAHFIHQSLTSGSIDDLEFNNPSDIPHSFHQLSYEQRAKYTNMEAFTPTGCDGKLVLCDITAFVALAKRALFDKACAEAFPNVRVRYMSGGTSAGIFIWSLWVLKKYAENPKIWYGRDAEKARDIKIMHQAEGNHCSFWDEPERAIQHYIASINL